MCPSRRRVLCQFAGAASLSLAGCLEVLSTDVADIEYEKVDFAVEGGHGSGDGTLDLFASEAMAHDALDYDTVGRDRRATVRKFVENTDFDSERLLFVAATGPDSGYRHVEIEALALDGDAMTGTAAVESSSDSVLFEPRQVSALVRVAFDDKPVDTARMTIVDRQGTEHEHEATVESR